MENTTLTLESPKVKENNLISQIDPYLTWYDFTLRKMEMWLQDLGEGEEFFQIKEGADEVFKFACKKESALDLGKHLPCWQPSFSLDKVDLQSYLSLLIETWVIHTALKICRPGTSELEKLIWEKPKILLFLAVSPTYHYRMLLGQFWPNELDMDTQEGLLSKNLLNTSFSSQEIQNLSREIFKKDLSENVIWQHTYRMRVEAITLLYTASSHKLQEIYDAMLHHHSREKLGQDIKKKIEGAYHRLRDLKIPFPPSLNFFLNEE